MAAMELIVTGGVCTLCALLLSRPPEATRVVAQWTRHRAPAPRLAALVISALLWPLVVPALALADVALMVAAFLRHLTTQAARVARFVRARRSPERRV